MIKFLAYGDNGNIAKVDDAVNYALLTGSLPPDVNLPWLRRRQLKVGGGVNVQQQISKEIGFFLRASMCRRAFRDGRLHRHRPLAGDRLHRAGALWGRDKDEIGVAGVFSGLAGPRIRYFGLGGLSVYIGDGALSYAGEKVFETYYKYNLRDGIELTLDYQFVGNPGPQCRARAGEHVRPAAARAILRLHCRRAISMRLCLSARVDAYDGAAGNGPHPCGRPSRASPTIARLDD